MLRYLRKARNYLCRRKIVKQQLVSIACDSQVDYRKITLKEDCALTIGGGSIVQASITFDRKGAVLKIGRGSFIGTSNLACAEKISIGDDVLISWGCNIVDHDSHAISWIDRKNDVADWFEGKKDWNKVRTAKVQICDKAWLGFNVTVLKGVTIGEGSIVGASAVVTKDVPPYSIVAGNPARIIREILPHER